MNFLYKVTIGVLLIVGLFALAGCEKDIDGYTQDPRLYFFERANDVNRTRVSSRTFTFLTLADEEMKDTLYIKVKTMGEIVNRDRQVMGKTIAEGTTAIEGVDFDFIPGLVPAGNIEGLLPVVLYRTLRLKNETVVLNLTIGETADFKAGVIEDEVFTLSWADRLIQPNPWPFYFGAYSNVKYQFIIDELGIAEFPSQLSPRVENLPGEYSLADLQDMASRLRVRLREVNTENFGKPNYPLRDENGALVVF
ncbi:DUF4843 domain-containing protein [Sphingobacterium olei]|uniref:DUF4843 domain-containing protein n=1 Tax=Sphingobacterium olei TaxID=2571155 RepID=A0A4V6WHW0_9SPHI|nr:DUF4843 domain-containing protein [Sphingobacterium olei]TJZ61068.1 DUF4843 domain-containing protein [Sphingobacterium olei]